MVQGRTCICMPQIQFTDDLTLYLLCQIGKYHIDELLQTFEVEMRQPTSAKKNSHNSFAPESCTALQFPSEARDENPYCS